MSDHLDSLPDRLLTSEWQPRPRAVPGLRRILADRITDPDWRSSRIMTDAKFPEVRLPITSQQDLREADLYFIDAAVAQTATFLAHAQSGAKADLADHVQTLQPDTPPAQRGFMVFGLPVAWRGPLFEFTAASWAPTRAEALRGGGVDIVAWAAVTGAAVDTAMRLAGYPDTARERQKAYAWFGPLLPMARLSWAYGQTIGTDAEEWVGAVQATWAAMGTPEAAAKTWRPSWLDRRRARSGAGGSLAPVRCVSMRRGVRPTQLADRLCR